jgi:hypothetical protein
MGKASRKQEGFVFSKDERGRDVIVAEPAPTSMVSMDDNFQPPAVVEEPEPKQPFVNPVARFADFIVDSGDEGKWGRLNLMAPVVGAVVIGAIVGFIRLVTIYPKFWGWFFAGLVATFVAYVAGWIVMWLIALVRGSMRESNNSSGGSGYDYY